MENTSEDQSRDEEACFQLWQISVPKPCKENGHSLEAFSKSMDGILKTTKKTKEKLFRHFFAVFQRVNKWLKIVKNISKEIIITEAGTEYTLLS